VRGGRGRDEKRESGIHQLYLDVISVTPLKSSKKRRGRGSHSDRQQQQQSGPPENDLAYQQEMLFIRSLALSPHCVSLLLTAFCPTIFGHELVKLGLLLGLFGGSKPSQSAADDESYQQPISSSFNIRSEIHVLVVGDPGLGKSQMLRAASRIAPRSVMVCGNTASTAGLTVALVREAGTGGEMSIEAGALVLADRGVCCIDELDKMTCDPHSLLEAMEQQSVSVAKSGVVTSLRSRATILAAANPSGGCYDRRKSVSENLKMASALLSRFDLVFIMLDKPDAGRDRLISEHIMRRSSAPASLSSSASAQVPGGGGHRSAVTMQGPREEAADTPSLNTLSHRIRDGIEGLRDLVETREAASRRSSGALMSLHALHNLLASHSSSSEWLRRYVEYARRCAPLPPSPLWPHCDG
jgi:DNA helicase MCM8